MTIEPVLTPDEWERRAFGEGPPFGDQARLGDPDRHRLFVADDLNSFDGEEIHKLIALANAALPDYDSRKITRTLVNALRFGAKALRAQGDRLIEVGISNGIQLCQAESIEKVADALESYLPPEGT